MNYNSQYRESEDESEKDRYLEDICKRTLNLQESYSDSLDLEYEDELFIARDLNFYPSYLILSNIVTDKLRKYLSQLLYV